jgi:hypothetical protein
MSNVQAVLMLVQWITPQDDAYEIEEFGETLRLMLLDGDTATQTAILNYVPIKINDPSPEAFLAALSEALAAHPDVQYIYFCSHGNQASLSFTPVSKQARFAEIAAVIRKCSRHCGQLELIFGSCESMAGRLCRQEFQGIAVRLVGFQDKPGCNDVGDLLIGTMQGEMELFTKISQINQQRTRDFNKSRHRTLDSAFDLMRKIQEEAHVTAKSFDPKFARYVTRGKLAFSYTWDSENRRWLTMGASESSEAASNAKGAE